MPDIDRTSVDRASRPRRTITLVWCVVIVALGLAIVIRTVVHGGGPLALGLLVGILFVLAGAGRFWTTWKGWI